LIALLDFQKRDRTNITQAQISTVAQDYCDASYTLPDAGKSYTAFNTVKTLLEKGYVYKNGKPAKYSLTETGTEMAEKLKHFNTSKQSSSNTQRTPSQSSSNTQQQESSFTSTPEMDLSNLDASEQASILEALSESSNQRSKSSSRGGRGRGGTRGRGIARAPKKSSTSSLFDKLLAEMGDKDPNEPDMSLYVLNPNKHQTMTLNGRTVNNTSTTNSPSNTPAPNATSSRASESVSNSRASSPVSSSRTSTPTKETSRTSTPSPKLYIPKSSSSSVTSANKSSFAQRVSRASDTNDFHSLHSQPKPTKRQYNIDEYEFDLTPSSLPTLNINTQSNDLDIVDLLSSPEPSPPPATSEFVFQDDLEEDFFPMSQLRSSQILNETFHFTYLNSLKEHVRHVTMADTQWIDEQPAYLVKFYSTQSGHAKARKLTQRIVDGEYTTAYAFPDTLDTVCSGLPATPVLPLHQEQQQQTFWPDDALFSSQPQVSNSQMNTQVNSQVGDFDGIIDHETCEKLSPHEYEIFLVLDNREIQMKTNRDYIQKRLAAKGVHCLTRSLDLGDVLWIAKKKDSRLPTDELVLGYIIERKRLDDLVTSIKDGRFTEQKTRLKKSGVDKVIYVVEVYNREEVERFGPQAIQTALSSTQIQDGIFLKRTNSIDETIDYLVSATNLVKKIYKDTTLFSIPGHLITQQNYLDLKAAYKRQKQPKQEYLVNYPLFNELNAKGAPTTVHDVYLHMLMTIRGVNAEKALSLMKVYPTPYSLLTAFRERSPEEGRVLAKNATSAHITRRKWGISISEKLYQTWGATSYPNIPSDSDNDFE
jgi:ERCC4-type nuclease/predicted transcriptional regulator